MSVSPLGPSLEVDFLGLPTLVAFFCFSFLTVDFFLGLLFPYLSFAAEEEEISLGLAPLREAAVVLVEGFATFFMRPVIIRPIRPVSERLLRWRSSSSLSS